MSASTVDAVDGRTNSTGIRRPEISKSNVKKAKRQIPMPLVAIGATVFVAALWVALAMVAGTKPQMTVEKAKAEQVIEEIQSLALGAPTERLLVVGADWCGFCRYLKAYLDEEKIPYLYMKVGGNDEDGLTLVFQWLKEHGMDVPGGRAGIPLLFSNAEGVGLRLAVGYLYPGYTKTNAGRMPLKQFNGMQEMR